MLDYSPANSNWTEADTARKEDQLRHLSGSQLRRQLAAAEFMASPQARWSGKPRECYAIQLDLVRAEIRRRGDRLD